jgi:hypothetical protein
MQFGRTAEFLKEFPYNAGAWLRMGRGSQALPMLSRAPRMGTENKNLRMRPLPCSGCSNQEKS